MGNVTEIFKLSVSKFTKLCDFTGDAFIVIYFRMVDPGAVQDHFDPDHDKQIELDIRITWSFLLLMCSRKQFHLQMLVQS